MLALEDLGDFCRCLQTTRLVSLGLLFRVKVFQLRINTRRKEDEVTESVSEDSEVEGFEEPLLCGLMCSTDRDGSTLQIRFHSASFSF